MTDTYTAAEWNALQKNKGPTGKKERGPIKMPKEKPETVARQLEQAPLDKVLSDIVIRTSHPAAVVIGPSRIEVDYMGHDLVLVPREQVNPNYLKLHNREPKK